MSKVDFTFSAVVGLFLALAFGFGWTGGLLYADHYAVRGLGKDEKVETPLAAMMAHNIFGHHVGAVAIKAAAAKDGQYALQGIFDYAHHAW